MFNVNEADFFTARWPNNGTDLIGIDVLDKDGKALPSDAFTLRSTQCMGECNNFEGSAYSLKLPRNQSFMLILKSKNGGDTTKPGWDQAQLVASR